MAKKTSKPHSNGKLVGKSSKRGAKKQQSKIVHAEIVENLPGEQGGESIIIDGTYSESDFSEPSLIEKEPAALTKIESKSLATADPMTLYLASIRKYPLLSKEEEQKLAKKYYETRDPDAAQALVTANLRFVVKVAAEYSKFGAKLIDLVQEGNIGLMHAVREFNPFKGVRLITYAVWWIRGYIQEYLMKQYSVVRIGTTQNQRKLFYQLQKEKELLDSLGENPDYSKLSEKLSIPADEIQEMRGRLSGRDVSLDRPLDDDTKATLGDLQKNTSEKLIDEELSLRENIQLLKVQIESLRVSLSDREKIILDERLLSDAPLTLQEIGEKYGITREAVRQMETRVMKKIKRKFLDATGEQNDENE